MKKRKRGRPSQDRTEYLEVRIDRAEKANYNAAAKTMGVSLSAWVRLTLNLAVDRGP